LSGTQIQSVTSTSFQLVILLSGPGNWGIRVNNPDGQQSGTFSFTANAVGPTITSVSPSIPTASGSNQTVTVFGTGFQANLTVTAFFPTRRSSDLLSGTQIQSVTSTSFQLVILLSGPGNWGIRVNNPDGQQSGT